MSLVVLPAGTIKRVHVNQFAIRRKEPAPLRVKTSKHNLLADEVEILGPTKVVYRPDKPLGCGAKCWVETRSETRVKAVD